MAYFLSGTSERKVEYFTQRHGGSPCGTIKPNDPDLVHYLAGLKSAVFDAGQLVILFRDGVEIELCPVFGDVESIRAHLLERDRSNRIDSRPVTFVAIAQSVAEAIDTRFATVA